MFIVSLTYKVPLECVEQFLAEHIEYLDAQYAKGHFILSGRKEPRTGGVILANMSDIEKLNEVLADDPFHREDLASYEVIEMLPSKAAKELVHLIDV